MPRYGDGSPYHFGNSYSNHSSLMTTIGSGRLHGPLVSRYSPHLSTISESPLNSLRRYSPHITSPSRPKRVDTADIDVSTPRNLANTENHGRNGLRRDRPTIRIRSQALKDNPALRELNEKHEKSVGELLVEKFLIRDKGGEDAVKIIKAYHQPSLERAGNEAIQKKVTRRLTRRRSSLEIPTDSEIIAREVIIAQAQAEALDSLLEQEQAQIKVEARRRTLTKRSLSRDSISVPSGSSDNELCANEEAERASSVKKIVKKTKKKKKILTKTLSQPEDTDVQTSKTAHLKQTKSDSNLVVQGQSSRDSGDERRGIRPQKFKIEACNSVGDFSTLWINASSAPTSPICTEQFRESIRLPAPKSNKDTLLAAVIDDDQSESDDDMVVLALPKRYVRDSTRNSVYLTLKTAAEEPTITRNANVDTRETSIKKNSSFDQLINSRIPPKLFNNTISTIDQVNDTENSKNVEQLEIKIRGLSENVENFSNGIENPTTFVAEEAVIKKSDDTFELPKKTIPKSNFQLKDISVEKAAQKLSDVPNPVFEVSIPPTEINDISIPKRIVQQSSNDIAKLSKPIKDIVKVGTSLESKVIAKNSPDNVSKLIKKPITKFNSQVKDVSVKQAAQNYSDVPHAVSEASVPSREGNDVSIPETIAQKSLKDGTELSKPIQDIVKVGAITEPKVIAGDLPDNGSKLLKKPMKKLNSQAKDVSIKKAAQNLSDLPNPVFEVSVPPTEINDGSIPETIARKSLKDVTELSKPVEGIIKFAASSEAKVITENSVGNVSKLPKKPIEKSNFQLKNVGIKKASNNLSDVPNPIFDVSVLPTKINNVIVPETTIQQSSNKIAEVLEPVQDIGKVSTNSEPNLVIDTLPLSPPISEVDFWGEIDPESSPATPTLRLSLKINNSLSMNVPVAFKKETVDIGDEKLTQTIVETNLFLAETDLDENSKLKYTQKIPSEGRSEKGKNGHKDVTTAVDSSLSISSGDKSSEINVPFKDQNVNEDKKLEYENEAQVLTACVDEDSDELPTPTPSMEEAGRNSVADPPLPTINIVAAPVLPESNGVESILDEDPGTPTNEWPNASLTMSKWVSQNDLPEATEVDKEATPTPPSGPDIGVSPQSSKKKKLVKKKKLIKKSESEDNGSMDSSPKVAKQVPEKSPKPSPQVSPKSSPRSSPRNSPKQRPIDLIRMFYTTPGPLLTATPRDLSKVRRGGRRRKRNLSTASSASDSTESARSTQSTTTESTEDNSSTCTEGVEEAKDEKRLTSTRSNDSGFDGSPRLTNCDMACHKKCEKLTGNLCGLNQKLVAEALQSLKRAPSQSSDSQRSENSSRFQTSGRITPPATNLPRFKKYAVTDFNFLKVLGKGSFGKVLLAELRDTDCLYAVKCLKKDVVLEDDDVECTLIERKVLTLATRHPYLCHLFCTFQTDSHLFFVMEYLNGGDLMFHIQRAGRFPEPRARFYAAEILSGLNFLHKKGIVYRDLKLDNVLLDFDGHIRIADFGMCKLQIYLDRTADTFCGTPDYMAPEIVKGLKYNQAVDWWSYGVLLYEMLTGQSPFSGCDEDELFWSICNERPFIPRYLTQEATDILVCLLEKDSGKRLPGHEIAIHPFFQGLPWDRLERRQLEPPFKPALEHTLDTRYFDSTFTAERPRLSIVPEQILISMDQGVFRGFSYTNPNATD